MTKTLQELYREGSIDVLFNRGFISGDSMMYFKYHEFYLKHRNNGSTFREAVLLTAIFFERSESTIKRAVRAVEE